MSNIVETIYANINHDENNKKLFCDVLNNAKEQNRLQNRFIDGLYFIVETGGYITFNDDFLNSVVKLLDNMLPYPDEQWVYWWVFDTKFGEITPNATRYEKTYCIKTPEDLWDFCYNKYED